MSEKKILALGFFDGVHMGHQALLNACAELAALHGCSCGAVTFENHPQAQVKGNAPGLINTLADRQRLLRRFGMEHVIVLPFNREIKTMPWQDFLRMLVEEHGAAGFVCGEDFRFGNMGQGNAQILGDYCKAHGFPLAVVPQQRMEEVRVSSSHIRHLMETGHMSRAVRFLGHPHILTGKVIHEAHRLGIPAANLRLPKELVVPMFGMYATVAVVDGVRYPAVTYVGTRPAAAGIGITAEPWIPDYTGELLDKEVTLEFYQFLCSQSDFSGVEALRQEMIPKVREILKSHS